MANKTMNSTSRDDVLDSFLTTIESKLRGPFSSLDLAKAVSTAALRQSSQFGSTTTANDVNDPAKEYLHNLSSVLGRTNKVIQCRMLIGLLGLNDMRTNKKDSSAADDASNDTGSQYLTPEILRILHETQEGSLHEEWVRTTSGLIEGVMFRTKDGSDDGNTRESCRGEEAAKIIRETGTEVCEKVERQIKNVGRPNPGQRKQQTTPNAVSGSGTTREGRKSNAPLSAAAANKRDRGFTIEKVIQSSSQPSIKKEEQVQSSIIEDQKMSVTGANGIITKPAPPDLNACFAPYRYRLISTPLLNTIIPEFKLSKGKSSENNGSIDPNGIGDSNCHFRVNAKAKILQVDLQLEAQRAQEHGNSVVTKVKHNNDSKSSKNPPTMSSGGKSTFPPGFRKVNLVPKNISGSSKVGGPKQGVRGTGSGSNLFMPKKKGPSNLFNTTTKFRPQPAKTMLRRKAGAQALLKSASSSGGAILNKLGGSSVSGSGVNNASRTRPGGVDRFSSKRDAPRGVGKSSRMKMIDDDDVDTLTKLQRSNANSKMTAAELRASKRKRIMEKAARRGIHSSGGIASGTTSSFGNQQHRKKQKLSSPVRPGMQRGDKTKAVTPQQQQQTLESWQSLLRDRSNKMSEDDRVRVEKFFTTPNSDERSALLLPSEGGPVYKMKIHEQRGKDPATGQEIKETFYLELDYETGESKQSKKIKRY